jgi:hypothetical protein
LSQTSFDFGEAVESAYPSIPNPSPAELMAKRVIEKSRRKNPGRLPPGLREKPRAPIPGERQTLSRTVVAGIRQIILAWPDPTITWEAIRAVVNTTYEAEWTRQAFYNHETIKKAYQITKNRLREDRELLPKKRKSKIRDSSVPVLQERIRYLEDRVIKLEGDIVTYKAQFATWQENAQLAGVPLSKLNEKRPGGDRGRSDK